MAILCPNCLTSQEQGLICTSCGSFLQPRSPSRQIWRGGIHFAAWMQNPWGRIAIGLLLSQGLFVGLRQLFTSAFMGFSGAEGASWAGSSSMGLYLWLLLQATAVSLSGFLVGTTQRHAFLLGALMGLWNGIFSALVHSIPNSGQHLILLYSQPLLHAVMAGMAALFGRFLFQPPASPALPGMLKIEPASRARGRRAPHVLKGPVHWFRIFLGVTVVVVGYLMAPSIFAFLMELGRGQLQTQSYFEDRILVWEIRVLIVLGGAVLAGATTANGLKQGLFVGVISFGILTVLPQVNSSLSMLLHTFISTVGGSVIGGWFGGQLLPPVVRASRLRRPGSMVV